MSGPHRVRVVMMTRSRVLVLTAGVIALAAVASLAAAMRSGVGQAPIGLADVPFEETPAVDLATFDGGQFVLADHAGGPVFVYFWASWCAPCREETPIIERLWPEYRERGYTFVGINIQDRESDARAFIDEFRPSFPIARDTENAYLDFGVYGVPESYFFARNLDPRGKLFGPVSEERLRVLLDALEREAPAPR